MFKYISDVTFASAIAINGSIRRFCWHIAVFWECNFSDLQSSFGFGCNAFKVKGRYTEIEISWVCRGVLVYTFCVRRLTREFETSLTSWRALEAVNTTLTKLSVSSTAHLSVTAVDVPPLAALCAWLRLQLWLLWKLTVLRGTAAGVQRSVLPIKCGHQPTSNGLSLSRPTLGSPSLCGRLNVNTGHRSFHRRHGTLEHVAAAVRRRSALRHTARID